MSLLYSCNPNLQGATKHARMKILGSTINLDVEVTDATQTVCDARFVFAEPVVVRDTHIIHIFQPCVLLAVQKVIKTLTAALLHAFKAEL